MKFRNGLFGFSLLLISSPAFAHVDPSEHGSFAAGFTHPVFGLDHVLAMIAVGLWAALLAGKAVLALPTAFVGSMVIGFGLALVGVSFPMVEPVILTSVVALGVLVALAARFPLVISVLIVGAFGMFHGHAHGGEIGTATELSYAAGFILATAILHAVGVLIGYGTKVGLGNNERIGELITRGLGGVTALIGLTLFAG